MSFHKAISHVMDYLPKSYLFIFTSTLVGYQIFKLTYNLFFHPLRHIPGPKLAAATYLEEFYYDVVLYGRYTNRIKEMHEQYGPLVRISPDEIHCNDSLFIDEIYAGGNRKRDKPIHQVRGSGTVQQALFSTINHDVHRMRRSALSRFFSRAQVTQLEPKIHKLAERLCDKILVVGKKDPFDVTTAYSLLSSDVISGYCFGESIGLVAQKSWEPNFRKGLYALLNMMYYLRFFPLLRYMGLVMAPFTKVLSADVEFLIGTIHVDIKQAKEDKEAGIINEKTVFGSLIESTLPPNEKSVQRLSDEAIALFIAATETISWALSVITYHVLTRAEILEKLTAEVSQVVDDKGELPSWAALEKLPYLGAVIYEGLRLSYGVASRTSRVPTGEDLVYCGDWTPKGSKTSTRAEYVIPRGYAIGMSSAITHHDESIFPDSHSFLPERWLDERNQHRKELDRSLLSFSKGSRTCIGVNLAHCELYTLLSLLTLRVFPRMKVYETTESDVTYDHDIFNPLPVKTSKGVRAIIV
ncbi:benzoate 4-monooxygenase cytochrome p450 [Amylocarpus encephaloides]|uniref:Benzoate 4-monooxygenase cytochrome p450 n=1 Tax=Amylocarpus encephaloides TaxID=45428 RepID=A0A9P7YIS0_9HELO|nr:benzoate 4-monooxygenase cytochrome p450 [Amylocarpus encephaloides]